MAAAEQRPRESNRQHAGAPQRRQSSMAAAVSQAGRQLCPHWLHQCTRSLPAQHTLYVPTQPTCGTSLGCICRRPGVTGWSGSLYSLSVRAMVMRGASRLQRERGGKKERRVALHLLLVAGRSKISRPRRRHIAPVNQQAESCPCPAPEPNADELLGVERAVPVLALGHRLGQQHTRSVHRLRSGAGRQASVSTCRSAGPRERT